ncbi:aminodeoxychorismate/anthranilate synthase component II [Megasphaera elsdenii]|uniref:anthranilate synthase component II n=1 Tax=Megasphaera elsdenii TaxID=907 RepID=UPI001D035844|nr:aminodeoxychorismate/anthranilate synthase component II [Megasphaera elsdenii]MCB5701668.1 aminodeoxychorismate/anthranilate synthase component II [Megasphaera elsdenii]MCB5726427.1 aminodeoxychorismate/anthranilate synthase component II [Megasphaera elsdenii]MCB5770206.1 aminodeoxychorismate/anthranilate synthase component II [Megasphaera elsdenii]
MIVLIDNYDSFSYNLYQLLGQLDSDITVIRNDEKTVQAIEAMQPDHLIISPGPGRPADAGVCEEAISYFAGKVPILGVCLGHQAICEVYGGTITYAKQLMHGKQSVATLKTDNPLFKGLPEQVDVGRYHSLALAPDTLPDALEVLAQTEEGEIMAVGHKQYPIYGLQFHPESILTPQGPMMVENFLKL